MLGRLCKGRGNQFFGIKATKKLSQTSPSPNQVPPFLAPLKVPRKNRPEPSSSMQGCFRPSEPQEPPSEHQRIVSQGWVGPPLSVRKPTVASSQSLAADLALIKLEQPVTAPLHPQDTVPCRLSRVNGFSLIKTSSIIEEPVKSLIFFLGRERISPCIPKTFAEPW